MDTSMRAGNHYTFLCENTGKAELLLACYLKRHKKWQGKQIDPTCATCMNAGKCPAVYMLQLELREGRPLYFDATPGRVRRTPDVIADRVAPVSITHWNAQNTGITPEALDALIARAPVVPHDPGNKTKVRRSTTRVTSSAAAEVEPETSSMVDAAINANGNVADLINDAA